MSEKEIKPRWLIALALEVPRGVYREVEDRLREEVAAAEERGRRSGVEERDELRACLEMARAFVAIQFARNPIPYNQAALARIVRALAPRDSGKETAADAMDAAMEAWEDRE